MFGHASSQIRSLTQIEARLSPRSTIEATLYFKGGRGKENQNKERDNPGRLDQNNLSGADYFEVYSPLQHVGRT